MKKRILVVDDDEDILTMLSALFRSDGYEVVISRGAEDAANILKNERPFQLAVSDVRMRPVDGMWLLDWIIKEKPDLPVVMITAYYTPEKETEALKKGAKAYLQKPFSATELLATVSRLTASPAKPGR